MRESKEFQLLVANGIWLGFICSTCWELAAGRWNRDWHRDWYWEGGWEHFGYTLK